jgi:abortive infection bacteriophage resistance protein
MEAHQGGFFMPLPMTIFPKPVLSTGEQVDLLVRRGMIVNDRQRALHCLQHINYYRLRAYWLTDEVVAAPGHHAFRVGTDFDRIINLYNFDRNLRFLVMDAIECVEISVRTRWAYVLAHLWR